MFRTVNMTGWRIAKPSGQTGSAVWHADLANIRSSPKKERDWLSDEERVRAARFLRSEDRDHFIRSHMALREVLAGYLDRAPGDLRFRIGHHGKPDLDGADLGRLHFNLSHSGSHALIGIAEDIAIGVDVEVARPIGDPMSIARAHFHSGEITTLAGLSTPERAAAFFACWTRKEAIVKALGVGLSLPFDSFQVSLPPAPAAILGWCREPDPNPGWSMHHLDLEAEAVGAVALARAGEPCALYRLATGSRDGVTSRVAG